MIFFLTPFIFVSTVNFVISIVKHQSMLLLMLSIIMLLPLFYSFMVPLFVYNNGKNILDKVYNVLYYYLGIVCFYTIGPIINMMIYIYTLSHIDDLNWNNININGLKTVKNNRGTEFSHKWRCFRWIINCSCSCSPSDEENGVSPDTRGPTPIDNLSNSIEFGEIWDSTDIHKKKIYSFILDESQI